MASEKSVATALPTWDELTTEVDAATCTRALETRDRFESSRAQHSPLLFSLQRYWACTHAR